MKHYCTALLITTSVLAGCSGLKSYPDNLESNLEIHTRTDSSTILSSIKASLDVYSVSPECSADYKGTVTLDASTVSVGLPIDQPSYLVFRFNSSSFLASSSSVTRYDTVFTPGHGRRYDIDVSYIDDIYNVTISEQSATTSVARVIETKDLHACRQ